jgi:hypothetical protein
MPGTHSGLLGFALGAGWGCSLFGGALAYPTVRER